jgi:hypothetical protein
MSLRDRIRLVAAAIRAIGVAGAMGAGLCAGQAMLGLGLAVIWLAASRRLLRQRILPALFPATECAGCRRVIPLVARWKCGDHFTDHRDRHILAFRCNQGHRLEGFDCPRCKSTILVQRGERQRLRHGSAVRLRAIPRFSSRGILIGHDRRGRAAHLPWTVLAWHAVIFGGTGRGKSTTLLNFIVQLIEQRIGFTLLDCGDLATTVRRLIPDDQRGDLLDLDVSDTANPFPLNVLSAATPIEAAMLTEELVELFRRMHGSAWGPVLEHQLRMGIRAASARGSLRDVYDLFTNPTQRSRTLARVTDKVAKSFWVNEFPAIPAIRRAAVVNKLAPIVFHPIMGPVIGAHECVLNADEVIANHRMVIVNLRTGSPADDVTNLLGTFIVQKVVAAAFRQGSLPEAERQQHVLLVDEFPRFLHRASSFDQIFSEARRYRLSLMVASQYVEQIDPATRAAIFGNAGALLAFRLGHRDSQLLSYEFTGSAVEDFTELGVGRCLARIGNDWSFIRTLPPPRISNVESEPATARQRPTTPADEVPGAEPARNEDDDEFVT